MFFLTSGYFFFRKFSKSYKFNNYIVQIKKRIKSLFIPYILWTIIGGTIVYIFYLTLLPSIGEAYHFENIVKWIIFPLNFSPTFQLWFIVDLMKLTIISPIIYFLVKKFKKKYLLIIFILWLLEIRLIGTVVNHLNIEIISTIYSSLKMQFMDGIFFFSLGSYLAIFNKENLLLRKNKKVMWITISLWLIFGVVYSILAISKTTNLFTLQFLQKTVQILGMLSIWTFYDFYITNWDKNKIIKLGVASTFMIYVSHEPILLIIRQLYFKTLGYGSLTHLTVYNPTNINHFNRYGIEYTT
ncbi:MAG: acyltransferase [archaeon]|nr:acyltransferase [archaeon]